MTIAKCHGCGVEKDREALEVYPFEGDGIVTDVPINPYFEIDCQPEADVGEWKRATICHQCMHRLNPDLWISQRCWARLNPTTQFEFLPDLKNS